MGKKCFGDEMKLKAFITVRRETYVVYFVSQHLQQSANRQSTHVLTL